MKQQRNPRLPHNPFSDEIHEHLDQLIGVAKNLPPSQRIAAFDADGTLWDIDLGETFFDFQIHNCSLPNLPADPWKKYEDEKKVNTRAAYLWLAQINAGQTLEQVEAWAEACVGRMNPLPIFTDQRNLVDMLLAAQFTVYVVTASIAWAVVPGARRLKINKGHVLGVRTKVENGRVSLQQDGPMTWKEGKAEALLQATSGVRPLFCSGNTTGDLAMMDLATHLQLAVCSRNNLGALEESERALQIEANRRRWLTHTF